MKQPLINESEVSSSPTRSYIEHLQEKNRIKAIQAMEKNAVVPENVRNETLSWVDREFRSDSRMNSVNENEGLDEIKVMQDQAQPGDEKIIEINNMNNTMDNKKKNIFKGLASPQNFNRITFNFDLSYKDSSPSSSNSRPSTPPPKFKEEIVKEDELEHSISSQYNSYGTFSSSNPASQLKYDNNNHNLFKDNNHHLPNSNDYTLNMKDQKEVYSYQNEKMDYSPISSYPETSTTSIINENTPLNMPNPNNTHKPVDFYTYMTNWTLQFFKVLPAVLLGVLLNLLDSLSYGIIIFPKHETMPKTYVQSGISMFLVSTVISQLVYCSGISNFKGGNGSMMIEVMPFLHIICQVIIDHVGVDHPKEIIATVMVAYSLSTILTGVVFYLLGRFKMGTIMSFFPRHILIGCIGGIGLFLVQTGIEIITGYTFELTLDYVKNIFTTSTLPIWLLSMALALFLSIAHTKIHHPLLTPTFFIALPIVFYIVVFIGGLDLNSLRDQGWLFNLISDNGNNESVPFYTFWTYFNFKKVQWSVLPYTFGTIFALVFFGILHVPINVPALSVSVNTDVDINKELCIHGYTNILSGFAGSLQNYLVYSNSVLFIRSGGNSNFAGFMLAVATFALLVVGTSFIKFVPTIIVGGLIFHLGFDLMKEALIDTFGTVSPIEYVTIILIVICMDIWGFTEGIIVGIVVACIFFIITLSRRKIVRSVHSGSELPSTVYRLKSQRTFLNNAGVQIKILRIQGFIFFGTFQQINDYINMMINKTHTYTIKYIIFDFKLVSGMDYSASEAFIKIKSNLKKKGIYLILCNLQPTSMDPLSRVGFLSDIDNDSDNDYFKYFSNYDSAIEWCENMLLETQYDASKREYLLKKTEDGVSKIILNRESSNTNQFMFSPTSPSPMASPSTPISFTDDKFVTKVRINSYDQPMRLLIQTLLIPNTEVDMRVFYELSKYFKCFEIKKSMVLWEKFSPIEHNQIYIVESGQALLYSVYTSSNNVIKEKVIGTLIPRSVIGDIEFFSKNPHRTKLVAQQDSKIWSIDYPNYENLCKEHPEIALKFIQLILHCSSERMENMLKHDFIKSCY